MEKDIKITTWILIISLTLIVVFVGYAILTGAWTYYKSSTTHVDETNGTITVVSSDDEETLDQYIEGAPNLYVTGASYNLHGTDITFDYGLEVDNYVTDDGSYYVVTVNGYTPFTDQDKALIGGPLSGGGDFAGWAYYDDNNMTNARIQLVYKATEDALILSNARVSFSALKMWAWWSTSYYNQYQMKVLGLGGLEQREIYLRSNAGDYYKLDYEQSLAKSYSNILKAILISEYPAQAGTQSTAVSFNFLVGTTATVSEYDVDTDISTEIVCNLSLSTVYRQLTDADITDSWILENTINTDI